jgi:uncharacterized membrane protein (GlpM family)
MTKVVSREEQYRSGLLPRPAHPFVPPGGGGFTDSERGVLSSAVNAAGEMITHRQQTHHAHSDDDAMSIAGGSLLYSVVYMVVFAVVVGAGAGAVWWYADDLDTPLVVLGALLVWGCASYVILGYNREQGLHHSASGIAHAEIQSWEDVAHHAIDAHIYLLERRWEREDVTAGTSHQLPGY